METRSQPRGSGQLHSSSKGRFPVTRVAIADEFYRANYIIAHARWLIVGFISSRPESTIVDTGYGSCNYQLPEVPSRFGICEEISCTAMHSSQCVLSQKRHGLD
jgi:hypothetical protein